VASETVNALPGLIVDAVDGSLTHRDARAFCGAEGMDIDQLLNRMAMTIAGAFDGGAMPFAEADAAANTIYLLMMDEASQAGAQYALPEPAFSIYVAFDEGEYQHQPGEDPVETYTRPQIRALLEDAGNAR